MRKRYDRAALKWRRNPYAKRIKKLVTIRLDEDVILYFKALSRDAGIPYQRLINLYLREAFHARRKPEIRWNKAS